MLLDELELEPSLKGIRFILFRQISSENVA